MDNENKLKELMKSIDLTLTDISDRVSWGEYEDENELMRMLGKYELLIVLKRSIKWT